MNKRLRFYFCLLCLPWLAQVAADRVLFDFESGTYAGWTYEGKHAFEDKPFDTTEALKWREDRRPTGWQGKYMVVLGDTRHGRSDDGKLISDEFTIDQPYLKFLYGGEVNPRVRVVLRVDGKVVRVGDEWAMYHAGTVNSEVLGQHCLIARRSKDLVNRGERRVVLRSESTNAWPEHAFLHSPVVCQDRGEWWLLAGPVGNMNLSRFHHSALFRSADPFSWPTAVKERTPDNGLFLEGGAKVLRDEQGRQWITHSGPWAGGVWLAPLHWKEKP